MSTLTNQQPQSQQLANQQYGFVQPGFTQGTTLSPSSPVLNASSLNQQNAALNTWQDPLLNKQTMLADDFAKRDALFHQVQLPQGGLQTAQSVPHTRSQLLPVGVQGFQQGVGGGMAPLGSGSMIERTGATTLDTVQSVQQPAHQSGFGQSGTIALKPICIEQEAVSFRPGPITIEQPPVTVQPEAITIPQPPIVIHPEPIVIPQAPLVFQPNAVSVPRQSITYQPDAITIARPSYTVQPIIQYDMRACANFGRSDFKQHVHIRLTNDQLMRQGLSTGNWVQSNTAATTLNQPVGSVTAPSSPVVAEHAKFFSRDRDYNYGNVPSTGDKFKDTLGVKNLGPQHPVLQDQASTFSHDRAYNYGGTSDRLKDTMGVRNYGPEHPVITAAPAM